MSHMNLYIRKEGVLKRVTVPVFMVKELLLKGLNEEALQLIFKRAIKDENVTSYDLGVFLVDTDKKAVVSAQLAFAIDDLPTHVKENLEKSWKYIELESETATQDIILQNLQ